MTEQELTKKMNDFLRQTKMEAKLDYCVYCGKQVTSFCNSHTIPRFILKNIEDKGMIYNPNQFLEMPIQPKENGINQAGTFHLICNECDSKIFKDYEEEKLLLKEPSNLAMAEIALKNTLKYWSKRNIEIKIYEGIQKINPYHPSSIIGEHKNEINDLDLKEIKLDFKRAKSIIEKKLKSGYHLIFWHKCDYVVPLAFQGGITLYGDLNGMIINNIYNYDPNYRLQYINICVLPLKDCSIIIIIIMFCHKDDTHYRAFERQFQKLTLEEKLNLICFMIVNYSEDFYLSKKVQKEILENSKMKDTTKNVTDILANSLEEMEERQKNKLSDLINFRSFPNLLDENHKI